MLNNNRLFVSAAGSGKTTLIINDALERKNAKILITTFTIENEKSIRSKFIKINKYIPSNVTILTWFSFLIKHGLRPYRYWDKPVCGLFLVNGQDTRRIPESNFYQYYFYDDTKVYSDKLSKLVCKCNSTSGGYVIRRLEKIFSHIYIDEIQDMSGYDFDILKLFINSNIDLTMVGDPRQCVYTTHNSQRYKQYCSGRVIEFTKNECKQDSVNIDDTTLNRSFRNSDEICFLANQLYSDYTACKSEQKLSCSHHGIFYVHEKDLPEYFSKFNPYQLRWDKRTPTYLKDNVMNFGESKGTEFEHIIIYPPKTFLQWLANPNMELNPTTKAKLYVAITRAFFSVAIVVKPKDNFISPHIPMWKKEQ